MLAGWAGVSQPRAQLWLLRGLVSPPRDNQLAADFLYAEIATDDPYVQWVIVRPDSLVERDGSPYLLHENLVNSLAKPGRTNLANVADFMCDLVTVADTWGRWAGRLPVIVNDTNVSG